VPDQPISRSHWLEAGPLRVGYVRRSDGEQRIVSVRQVVIAIGVVLSGLIVVPSFAQVQNPSVVTPNLALTERISLEAEGAVRFRIPAWKKARHESAVALLERAGKGGMHMLLLAIEPGPQPDQDVDWSVIRGHIIDGFGGGVARLELVLAGQWEGLPGFKAHRMEGVVTVRGHRIAVHLLALVGAGRLVTVTVLGESGDATSAPLMESVARTVELGR
jgi:hypothetical protein